MAKEKEPAPDEFDDGKDRPYQYYEQKVAARQLHYYLSGPIEDPSKYTEMVHQIRTAAPNDVVHIHLNTPGGLISTGVQLVSAMRACNGHVVTHLEGEACSMGALLFLTGDEMVVYDNSLLMFHNYSGGTYGKGHELTASVDASNRWYSRLARTLCIPFLSEDELTRIFDGADVWMLSDEVEDRLKKMAKKLKEEEAKKASVSKKKTNRRKVSVK